MSLKQLGSSRIVIVDADSTAYEIEAHDTQKERSRFEFHTTARSALRSLQHKAPELCVVNLELPDMSGLDLYQMLSDRWPGVPVYLIGNHYNPEDEIRARCSGATLYFCKPLEPGWLSDAAQLVA